MNRGKNPKGRCRTFFQPGEGRLLPCAHVDCIDIRNPRNRRGKAGEGLSPADVVTFASGYGAWVEEQTPCSWTPQSGCGERRQDLGALGPRRRLWHAECPGPRCGGLGVEHDPTVELAVPGLEAQGGIILTASHNPKQWNALKLLDANGEFLSAQAGERVLRLAKDGVTYAEVTSTGQTTHDDSWLDRHVQHVLDLALVDADLIRSAELTVAVDAVNSSGGIAVPKLLEALGVNVVPVHCEPTGHFAHNPEPLPKHLDRFDRRRDATWCALGISVDPDVDRLCFVCEDGSFFGEEYTLWLWQTTCLRTRQARQSAI